MTASIPHARYASAEQQQPAAQLTFEQLDRNRDGYVDRAEALAQPGLDAVFNAADRRPDGEEVMSVNHPCFVPTALGRPQPESRLRHQVPAAGPGPSFPQPPNHRRWPGPP